MLRPDNAPSFTAMNDGLGNVFADALTTPTSGAFGLKLYDYNTLKQGGYSDSQIQEAVEGGYAPSLIKLLEPTAALPGTNQTMIDSGSSAYQEDEFGGAMYLPFSGKKDLGAVGPPGFYDRNTPPPQIRKPVETMEDFRKSQLYYALGGPDTFGYPGGRGRGLEYYQGQYPAMDEGIISLKDINTTDKYILPFEGARTIIKNPDYIEPLNMDKFAGIMQATDIDDDQSDEVVEQQNFFQRLMNNSLAGRVGGFLQGIFRPKQSDRYRPATMGIGSFTPAALNRMNALGGYYSEPARQQRRIQNRIANMIKRRDAGQNYSEKNLANLQAQMSGQPSQAQFATTKAAARSPKVGVSGYTSADVARESRRTGQYG